MTERGKALQAARAQVLAVRAITKQQHKASTEIEKEYFERKINQETKMLVQTEARARKYMDGMKPQHYAFCVMYYIAGMSLADVAENLDRSERQCERYKRDIEKE